MHLKPVLRYLWFITVEAKDLCMRNEIIAQCTCRYNCTTGIQLPVHWRLDCSQAFQAEAESDARQWQG